MLHLDDDIWDTVTNIGSSGRVTFAHLLCQLCMRILGLVLVLVLSQTLHKTGHMLTQTCYWQSVNVGAGWHLQQMIVWFQRPASYICSRCVL